MAIELLCRKIGMTRVYDEGGVSVPVTVLEAGPNPVVQKKTQQTDGYDALQLGFGTRKRSRTPKAVQGHFEKAKVAPRKHLRESRVTAEEAAAYEVGQDVTVGVFQKGQRVDVIGTSKGRGTAGVVKRHHFAIKKESHGTHEGFRLPGSIGAGTYPGHVIKGLRMPGRMGNGQVTVRNVVVVRIDPDRNLLLVRGAVPGANDGLVRVRAAIAPRR